MKTEEQRDNTPVSITVELPEYLCRRAEQEGIDLSRTLTEALKRHLGVE